MVDVTEKSRITEEIRESDNLATSEKVSSTTRLTSTTIVSSTKSTTNSTTYVATKTQAETKTTTAKIITTAKKATINIIVTQSGEQKTTKTVMVNAGETFTFNDAKNYVKAMGYDTSTAMYEGSLPITAESGKVYSIIIDVE